MKKRYFNNKLIELKAKIDGGEKALSLIRRELKTEMGFKIQREQFQEDTYFIVPKGRLKLRISPTESYLVYYERLNKPEPKKCENFFMKIINGEEAKAIFKNFLKILCIVRKKRTVAILDNIRIHLDKVESLGFFIEIESIRLNGILEDDMRKQVEYYFERLGLKKSDLIRGSYSDLIISSIPSKNL